MGLAENLTLAIVGELAIGVVFFVVIRSVRRMVKSQPRPPVRAVATIRRSELSTPPRRELTR